ncbi:MAG: M20/M25/M40 family metallo-hydrolase [Bacillota bacterium]|nr:M20/M25/M40 family metallo-hydrolase [Bacillota bacterium]
MIDLLKDITELTGVSGHEAKVRARLRDYVTPLVKSVRSDALGNLLAASGDAGGLKVLVAAHMDEVGIMARKIDDKGFVRFTTLGSLRPQVLLGQRVKFTSGLTGVIGAERLDDMKDLQLSHLYVDIGASSKQEALDAVRLGDTAAFQSTLEVRGEQIIAKALDDRIGCAIMIECMKRLPDRARAHNYCWAFTSQEEVGVRGAQVAAQGLAPDVAVVVDVTPSGDTPKGADSDVAFGGGATIKIYDTIPPLGGFVAPPGLTEFVRSVAIRNDIKWQADVLERGSTDAMSIHLTGSGVPCVVISVPTRYAHTPHEIVDRRDVEQVVRLVLAVLDEIDAAAIGRMFEI